MIYSLFHWRFYFNHWSFSVYFKTDLEDLWFSHTYRCMPSLEISVAGCIRWVSFRINGRKLKYDIHQWTFFSRRMSDGLRSSFWAHVHIILQCYKRIPGIYFFFTVNDVIIYRKKICNLTIDNDLHLNSQPWRALSVFHSRSTTSGFKCSMCGPKTGSIIKRRKCIFKRETIILIQRKDKLCYFIFFGGSEIV